MKKIFKESFIWFYPFLIIVSLIFALNIIKKDFKYAHASHMVWKAPFNWLPYYMVNSLNKFFIKITDNKKVFLPQINLYVSERSTKNLLSNLPASTKKWQKGKIIYENDKEINNIQYRYRGDNPDNWSFEKKSIRLKFTKKGMRGKQRYFEYWPLNFSTFLSNDLAINSEVLTSKSRLVELFVNDQSKGIFMELEKIDENFLRRNNLMPVNIYKGENYNAERKVGLNINLYNNSGLWSKSAYFNKNDFSDNLDLEKFLKILNSSFNNKEFYSKFSTYIDIDVWARYSAYLIISQNHHHTAWHNARLIFDPWNGKITPIITDPEIYKYIKNEEDVSNLDFSTNDMIKLLNLNPLFIDKKYFYINNFLKNKSIIDASIKNIELKKELILGSASRDPSLKNSYFPKPLAQKDFENSLTETKKRMKIIQKKLIKVINSEPVVSWKNNKNRLSININGELPASNLRFYFEKNAPNWIFIDENYNGKKDFDEIKYFKKNTNYIDLEIDLYANRLTYNENKNFSNSNTYSSLTKFDFYIERNIKPSKIELRNKFNEKKYIAQKNDIEGSQTTLFNKPLHKNKSNVNNFLKIFSGNVIIEGINIFNQPVKIMPGTIFKMKKNSSLIFKNKLEAKGLLSNKIKFYNFEGENSYWGTIALLGKKSQGSTLSNIEFNGGSGAKINQYLFTSMLSLHNTEDILIENVSLKNNFFYDDSMHIIYSKNIVLKNINFENSFGDALDIDISNNIKILNSTFFNSKNDGVDLMQSSSLMENNTISFSGDKGISVGEGSEVLINNTSLFENKIGIAVKDGSKAIIKNSSFLKNKNEISAYKKKLAIWIRGFCRCKGLIFQ